jgi:peptidoglycan/xylan/chitin deacetylase (PgdA/CDA1 family)
VTKFQVHILLLGTIILGSWSCSAKGPEIASRSSEDGVATDPVKTPVATTDNLPKTRVSNRPANENGVVFIAEYHHIREGKSTMERSPKAFRKDLQRLYKLGFRPINVTEYLSGDYKLPPGASPVVLTFDDSNPSQVRFLEDGTLDPDCGLGILKAFSEEHPDFSPKAVFFVLPELWGQPAHRDKKVALIKGWGGEIANHTITHSNLGKLPDEKAKEEIGRPFEILEQYEGNPEYLALPLGISPKNKSLLAGFKHGRKDIELKAVFLVGANPASTAQSDKFDYLRIPRIQACEGLMGLDYWLDQLEDGKVRPYVAP